MNYYKDHIAEALVIHCNARLGPGFGPKKLKSILDAGFKTWLDIENASIDDITKIKGLSKKLAEELKRDAKYYIELANRLAVHENSLSILSPTQRAEFLLRRYKFEKWPEGEEKEYLKSRDGCSDERKMKIYSDACLILKGYTAKERETAT